MQPSVILYVIVLLTAVSLLYSRRVMAHPLATRFRWLLSLVRMTFLLLVFWLCFKPSFARDEQIQIPNRVLLLLDDSFSMTLDSGIQSGNEQPGSRENWVRENIFGKNGLVSRLGSKGFQCQIRSMSDGTIYQSVGDYKADSPRSAIGEALRRTLMELDDSEVDKILLVTDGCNNAGEDPLSAAHTGHAPVFTLGTGATEQPTDLAIRSLVAPERAFRDQAVGIRVDLEALGDVDSATVVLSIAGNVILSATTSITHGKATVDFETSFDTEGTVLLRAEALPIPGEALKANNSTERAIHVTRGLANGLVVWGAPDWEFRFLARALREDKRLAVSTACAVDARQTLVVRALREEDDTAARTESETLLIPIAQVISEQIAQGVDWIVLGNLAAPTLGAQGLETLAQWVSESGGNLLLAGGPRAFSSGGYSGTALERVLPVTLSQEPDYRTGQPTMDISEAGKEHLPFAAITASPLPPLAGFHAFESLKPGATVLFSVTHGGVISPGMVTGRSGLGRVLVFGGFGTWSWQMYPPRLQPQSVDAGTGAIHGRFWRACVDYLSAEPGSSVVSIETDKSVYEQGSEAQVWVSMPSSILGASPEGQLRLSVLDPDGETDTLILGLRGAEGGIYTGLYRLRKSGIHTIELPWAGHTSSREITAEPPRIEFAQLVQNVNLLQSLAHSTGGVYLPSEQWEQLPEKIPFVRKSVQQKRFILLGQQPWFLGLLIGLLAVEWIVRRRVGLP